MFCHGALLFLQMNLCVLIEAVFDIWAKLIKRDIIIDKKQKSNIVLNRNTSFNYLSQFC